MELRSASLIDTDIEGHYTFFPLADDISTRMHHHDFFEIFLIAEGHITHHINGHIEHIERGALVFIRPPDVHCFSQYQGADCKLINLAFTHNVFEALASFLDMPRAQILAPELPPTVALSTRNSGVLRDQLQQWGQVVHGDKAHARRRLRALLAHIISQHFFTGGSFSARPMPVWLQDLIQEMRRPEHFIEGRDALLRLANRTPEYVGRSFKQYLDMTPSQFINELRLDHARDLLLYTDLSPTDIAFDAGFGNLSYFYALFKDRWDCSPNQFRRQHQKAIIP